MNEKSSELEQLILEKYSNIAGIVVQRGGINEYERYYNGSSEESRIHVYSVTKSIISILVGIAIDKGYIKSVQQKVLDFFPDYKIKRGEKVIEKVTLENLLTMTAPYKYKSAPYTKYFSSSDWVSAALDLLGGKDTIGEFRYTPLIGPDILSGILVKATGKSVLDFSTEHLFKPLGIETPPNITLNNKEEHMAFSKAKFANGWVCDPKGINTAGWGLTLSAVDMAKIGQLYLNNGVWNEKQIVSASWVATSTKEHSRWQKENLPYGYLWWIIDDGSGYAAMGDGGNIIYVNPSKELVVSIISTFIPRPNDRIKLIRDYIEPIFTGDGIYSVLSGSNVE